MKYLQVVVVAAGGFRLQFSYRTIEQWSLLTDNSSLFRCRKYKTIMRYSGHTVFECLNRINLVCSLVDGLIFSPPLPCNLP